MKSFWQGLVIAATLCAVWGCTAEEQAKPSGGETANSGTAPEKPLPTLAELPDKFKNDAYEFYGLSNANATPMEMSRDATGAPSTGTQTAKLIEIKDDEAIFQISRTGQLSVLGSQEVALREDGIYTISSSLGRIEANTLEMPAKLEVGTTWKTRNFLDQADRQRMEYDAEYKVVGDEKITVKAGSFQCLRIESSGPVKINDQDYTMRTTSWYSRGFGPVLLEVVTKDKDGKETKVRIEATQ